MTNVTVQSTTNTTAADAVQPEISVVVKQPKRRAPTVKVSKSPKASTKKAEKVAVATDTNASVAPVAPVAETAAPVVAATTVPAAPENALVAMEKARMSWETNELAASNKRLYSILTDAYSYYMRLKQHSSKDVRMEHAQELNDFIEQRGYTFMASTHDMTRVVKCVFGVDRRRVSAYSIALREALRQGVTPENLAAYLEAEGGVEQVRLGGKKPLSVTKRAEKVVDQVKGNDLGKFKFDASVFAGDADWVDKQVVIVATYLPTGEFIANVVVRHDGAVNAALAAHYSSQQLKQRQDEKSELEQEKARADAEKREQQERKAAEKLEKQKAAVAEEKRAKEHQAAIDAQANVFFEGVLN